MRQYYVHSREPKTGQQKVQFCCKDDWLWPSCYYLSMFYRSPCLYCTLILFLYISPFIVNTYSKFDTFSFDILRFDTRQSAQNRFFIWMNAVYTVCIYEHFILIFCCSHMPFLPYINIFSSYSTIFINIFSVLLLLCVLCKNTLLWFLSKGKYKLSF